ncbi:MAG: hypothetical protein R3D55_20815 [Chloroflexota bacterium]
MNQLLPRKTLRQPRSLPLVGLLLLLLLLTACIGGGEETAPELVVPEAAVGQQGSLTCSQTCLAQGQCGTAADSSVVILAHSAQPALRDHDTLLANDTAVTIIEQRTVAVSDVTGAVSSLNFFYAQPAGGPPSWVAGSCVNLP